MGKYFEILHRIDKELEELQEGAGTKNEFNELCEAPLPPTAADTSGDYRMYLLQSKKLWQGVCLEYAEALGWPPLSLDSYRSVVPGAHGWHLYLNRASMVELKNHVAPTLKDLIKELT